MTHTPNVIITTHLIESIKTHKMCDGDIPDKLTDNKENKINSKRQQRTKKEQFDLLTKFFMDNNESFMDSDLFQKNWSDLVVDLNGIGPPSHTVVEWRRVWSDFKYNSKKRKRSDFEEGFS